MKKSPKLEKWLRWQELILSDVIRLHASKQIYDDYIKIVNANQSVASEGVIFHNWIVDSYITFAASTIRRQAELSKANNKDVISLGKLIEDIQKNPQELTRDYHVSLYTQTPDTFRESIANSTFTEHAGDGAFIDPKIPEDDLKTLLAASRKIEDLTDIAIAHHTAKKHPEITFKEVDECIDTIKKLTQKYVLLLTAAWNEINPIIDDWQGVFTEVWIK